MANGTTNKNKADNFDDIFAVTDPGINPRPLNTARPAAKNSYTPPDYPTSNQGGKAKKLLIIGIIIGIIVVVLAGAATGWWFFSNQTGAPTENKQNLNNANNLAPEVNEQGLRTSGGNYVNKEIDPDFDGLTTEEENKLGTDPNNADSDGDALLDREEVKIWQTDPLKPDSDGDGFTDGEEIQKGYNPNGEGKILEVPKS